MSERSLVCGNIWSRFFHRIKEHFSPTSIEKTQKKMVFRPTFGRFSGTYVLKAHNDKGNHNNDGLKSGKSAA